MVRFGLYLALRGGREALVRLVVTAAAVAVGVTVLLALLADFHAFQATSDRPCWECTKGTPVAGRPLPATAPAELWRYDQDFFDGRTVERLDVAALGPDAPTVPGLARLPDAGRYDVSPALAALLRTTPRDELGARFPGTQAGTIGDAALSSPDELVIVVGYTPRQLATVPGTKLVDAISLAPRPQSTTQIYRISFGMGAIALLLPLMIFVGTATRLAAARREERYASMRLVGATPRQIDVVASVDATIGAVLGTLIGAGLFVLVRPAVADVSVTGDGFLPEVVTPTAPWYLAVLVGVPVAAALGSLLSLRRVRISPLGVSRRERPPAPRAWRVVPLLIGIVLFLWSTVRGGQHVNAGILLLGFVFTLFGLMIGGSWLTMRASLLLARHTRGPASLLAARRLADNPRAAFRAVSGLVLAVFVGTLLAGVVPAAIAAMNVGGRGQLTDVLRLSYSGAARAGLAPRAGAELVDALHAYRGTSVVPIYTVAVPGENDGGPGVSVIGCGALARLPALGACPAGATNVEIDASGLFTDNPASMSLPVTDPSGRSYAGGLASLPLGALLVKVDDPATLERVRTFLATDAAATPTAQGNGSADVSGVPETFGEVAQTRDAAYDEAQRIVFIAVAITLIVAGCSLAVGMGGGLVERKRAFTMLRLSGTSDGSLYRTVLLESLLPLAAATLVAVVVGWGLAVPVARLLTPDVGVPFPGGPYYATVGAGLAASLALILATLPLLGRLTRTETFRFE